MAAAPALLDARLFLRCQGDRDGILILIGRGFPAESKRLRDVTHAELGRRSGCYCLGICCHVRRGARNRSWCCRHF